MVLNARNNRKTKEEEEGGGGGETKNADEGYVNRTLLSNGNPLHVAAFLSIFAIEAEI